MMQAWADYLEAVKAGHTSIMPVQQAHAVVGYEASFEAAILSPQPTRRRPRVRPCPDLIFAPATGAFANSPMSRKAVFTDVAIDGIAPQASGLNDFRQSQQSAGLHRILSLEENPCQRH